MQLMYMSLVRILNGDTTKSYNATNLMAHLKSNHSSEYVKLTELHKIKKGK